MKKLTLVLALALGVANVSAQTPAAVEKSSAKADLYARIKSSDLNETEKAGVMALVKNHKALTTAVALVLVAGGAYAVDAYCGGKGLTALMASLPETKGAEAGFLGANVVGPVLEHKGKAQIAAVVTLVAILAACEKETLVNLYKNLTAKAKAEEAKVEAN